MKAIAKKAITNQKKLSTRELCFVSISVAVMVILAQVSIPLPLGVPLTLQTFAVMLIGIVVGPKKAAIAMIVYILLGAVGVPVFTQFGGGFHRIIGPWGGFIMSYPLMAFVVGLGCAWDTHSFHGKCSLIVSLVIGVIINLSAGALWFAFVNEVGLGEAFAAAFAPFIIVEVIKIGMAFGIGLPIRHNLGIVVYNG